MSIDVDGLPLVAPGTGAALYRTLSMATADIVEAVVTQLPI